MFFVLSVLAMGAVGIHLEEIEDVSTETARAIAQALAESTRARIGEKPRVDDPTWAACTRADRCLRETRARLEAESIVLVQVYGGPINMRVIAELVTAGSSTVAKTVELDVPRDEASWPGLFDDVAAKLFAAVAPAPASTPFAVAAPVGAEPRVRILPWALAGASAVALGVGIGFGASASGAESRLNGEILPGHELDALSSRMSSHQLWANVFIAVAVLAAGGSAALFIFD